MKLEPKDEADIKKEKDLQKKIEKQNKTFHKYRSALSEFSKNDLHELLEANSQEVLRGRDEVSYSIVRNKGRKKERSHLFGTSHIADSSYTKKNTVKKK